MKPGLASPSQRLRRYAWASALSKLPAAALWSHGKAASLAMLTAPEWWLVREVLTPSASGLGRVRTSFAPQGRDVWLTIDDGPDPRTTPPLLDLLDRHGAKATFFVIGEKARRHPDILRRIAARGHGLGNHTDSHPLGLFWCAGPRRTGREIDACSAAIEKIAGTAPVHFRPPAGIKNPFLFKVLASRGLALIGWSARGREGRSARPERPLARLTRGVRPGAILLTHESGANVPVRMAVIAGLLDHLARHDYRCVLPAP